MDMLQINDFQRWSGVTPVPHTPSYLCGVMNLHGDIVPVIDLRTWFGCVDTSYSDSTIIIIVTSFDEQHSQRHAGLVVDTILESEEVMNSVIKPAPNLGDNRAAKAVTGLFSKQNSMVRILDLHFLLNHQALA